MDVEGDNSNLLALILGPIGGLVLLIALCYCCYRCCCCCCRDNKQVVVVNTTNMLQPQSQPQPMMIVNNMPPFRTEFDNPVYNLPPLSAPLLSEEIPQRSDIQLNKF